MEQEEMVSKLEKMLSAKRFEHSIGVQQTAVTLAKQYGADEEKASIAGLLHDCAKDFKKQQVLQLCLNFDIVLNDIYQKEIGLIHGPLGARVATQTFGINDAEILDAIYFHTFGKANMPLITKIVYLADLIEPSRDYPGVQALRNRACEDLDRAILAALDMTIKYVLVRNKPIHPKTIEARNYILLHR